MVETISTESSYGPVPHTQLESHMNEFPYPVAAAEHLVADAHVRLGALDPFVESQPKSARLGPFAPVSLIRTTARYERGYFRISSNELMPQWRVEYIIIISRLDRIHVYVNPNSCVYLRPL